MSDSAETAKLDLQGPMSRVVLAQLVPDIGKLEYYCFDEFDLLGQKVIISRTGYTGELGYEIYYPWTKAKDLWQEILKNGNVKPTGLGVRDVLRIEMCYPLYGHELDETISPLEAGLKKFVDVSKKAGLINNSLIMGLGVGVSDLNNDGCLMCMYAPISWGRMLYT